MVRIQSVGIIGAGQMGAGIAQVLVLAGYDVVLNDIDAAQIDGALEKLKKSLDPKARSALRMRPPPCRAFSRRRRLTRLLVAIW